MTVIYKLTKTIFELKAIYFFTVKNFSDKTNLHETFQCNAIKYHNIIKQTVNLIL